MGEKDGLSLREAASANDLFARPRLGTADILALLWLGKWWILAVTGPILAAGLYWAASVQDRSIARATLLATQGEGPAAYASLYREGERLRDFKLGEGAAAPGRFVVRVQRNRSALDLRLEGQSGEDPSEILDGLIGRYLALHHGDGDSSGEVGGEIAGEEIGAVMGDADTEPSPDLSAALSDRRAFQARHGIADLVAEAGRVEALVRSIDEALVAAEARAARLRRQLAALDRRLQDTPERLSRQATTGAQGEVAALRQEREALLTRYTPQSVPVQVIDRQIEALLASADAGAAADRPAEPNPVFVALQGDRADLLGALEASEAERAALAGRRDEAAARARALSDLEPEWRRISRQIEALENPAGASASAGFSAPGQSGAAALALSRAGAVKLSNPAETERQRIRLGTIVAAILSAWLTGVLYARSRKGFATPNSAARTLNRAALAAVPSRR